MLTLYVNAAFRKESRTGRIADAYMERCSGDIEVIDLGRENPAPLNAEMLEIYNTCVKAHRFDHPMFGYAKQFAKADEIVISAPFWNYGIPAVLHSYLEMVCTQGISFDVSPEGEYLSGCRAKKLVYITTAGGYIPEHDHAFGYVRVLAEQFWHIPEIKYIKAEGLDIWGTDVEAEIEKALSQFTDR